MALCLLLALFLWRRFGTGDNVVGKSSPGPQFQDIELRFEPEEGVHDLEATAFGQLDDGRFSEGKICARVAELPKGLRCRLPSGRYWILGRASGFARFALRAHAKRGDPTLTLTVRLQKAHALHVDVRVRDDLGEVKPLADATVLIQSGTSRHPAREALSDVSTEPPFGALTDRAGKAAFVDLGPGPYHIQVFARGTEPYEAEIESDPLIVLRPARALRVTVRDQGRPAPEALVHVAGLSLWPPRQIRANRGGKAEIYGLAPGRYAVTAELGSRVTTVPRFVELTPGTGALLVELDLGPGAEVEVQVRDKAANRGVPGAHVSYAPDSTLERVRVQETDQDGRAKFAPLAQTHGSLQVSAAGYVSKAAPVEGPGIVVVELAKGGSVSGVVRNERGEPIADATVKILGHDDSGLPILVAGTVGCTGDAYFAWMGEASTRVIPAGELGVTLGPVPPIPLYMRAAGPCPTAPSAQADTLRTGADGRFSAHGVAPGTVIVLAEHLEYQSAKSQAAHLESGAVVTLDVTLRSGEPFSGRLLDHRDFPVPAALVRVTGRDFEREVRTESDGTFRLQAAPEAVTVRVLALGTVGATLEARVSPEERHAEVVIHLPAPREGTRARVLDADGRPIDFAEVQMRSVPPEEPYRETRFTNAAGEADFPSARGRTVTVRVLAREQVTWEGSQTLGASEVFQLTRASRVGGRITAVRGRWPAPQAEVRLRCGEQAYSAHTGDAGEYEIFGVPSGACRLRADHAEHGSAELLVQVGVTEHGRAFLLPDLDLAPPVRVHGVVRDSLGSELPYAIVSAEPLPPYLPLDSSNYPKPWVEADEHGRFELSVHFSGQARLFAVQPGVGRGEAGFDSTALEEQSLEIQIKTQDPAAPEVVGTVLFGLKETDGKVVVDTLLVGHTVTRKLRLGDEIVSIEHERPKDRSEARAWLSGSPGSEVELEVRRGAQTHKYLIEREVFRRPGPRRTEP